MTTVAATPHAGQAQHDDRSFVSKYIFSTDHKYIAKQYLFAGFFHTVGNAIRLGQLEIRRGWIQRLRGDYGLVLANGAIDVAVSEQLTELR